MCQKEALHYAQCAYFVSIVVVQWADLVICKTRMNSLYHQGMTCVSAGGGWWPANELTPPPLPLSSVTLP